jgi:hypothetical protein
MKLSESALARHAPALALAFAMVLAAAVRLAGIGLDGLSSDEAFSWRMVQYPTEAMLWRAEADVHPPLYYVLLKPWLALCGDSPLALRGLSALLGVLLVPAVFALVRECRRLPAGDASAGAAGTGAALLAAYLVALHPAQVLAGQNARMYSLSALLATLSTVVLLRALRRGRGYWVYGAWAAATAYAHYYGFFTIAAQILGALGLAALRPREKDDAPALAVVRGLSVSGLVALALYAPWLPAFLHQTTRVAANYWIPSVTPARLSEALFAWMTGLERWMLAPSGVVTVLLLLVTALAALRARRSALFLLAQAVVPWLLALGLSVLGPRPVFLPRYLIPIQVFVLLFWAQWAFDRRARWARLAAAIVLVALTLAGYAQAWAARPTVPSAEQNAAEFLATRWRPEDVFLTDSPRALNRMRYYLAQRGIRAPETRCLLARPADETGHFAHTAALAAGEIVEPANLERATWRRLWWGTPTSTEAPLPSSAWQGVVIRGFEGWAGTRYTLARYVPRGSSPDAAGANAPAAASR